VPVQGYKAIANNPFVFAFKARPFFDNSTLFALYPLVFKEISKNDLAFIVKLQRGDFYFILKI